MVPRTYEEFLRNREIPREPDVPELSPEDIARISDLIFPCLGPSRSDLLWVFGSTNGAWGKVADAYRQGLAPQLLVSGNLGRGSFEKGQPLSHITRDALVGLGIPSEAILVEDGSRTTLEEVQQGKALLRSRGIAPTSILFACKSHHCGRVLRTLKKYFADVALSPLTYDGVYTGCTVRREDWSQHPRARSRVYGEYLRITTYSSRGDIEV